MTKTIACIGSGNMGFALMKGAVRSKGFAYQIGFSNRNQAKAVAAAKELNASVYASNSEAAREGDFVFLAVKPQSLAEVLAEIGPTVCNRIRSGAGPLLISMAPGWSVQRIEEALSGPSSMIHPQIVRIMPNTPVLIGQGLIAVAASPEIPDYQLQELTRILAGSGTVEPIDEPSLDAVAALSGSGPAFVYLFIEALADGGVRAGLPRDKALRYATQTVLGSAGMVKETGKHPGELKDMVTSPGGTTIEGIAALEKGAFRGAVMNAVDAAWMRAKALSGNT